MTASISFDQTYRFPGNMTRHRAGYDRVSGKDTPAEMLLGIIIVIVIVVLLLSQGDPGVGTAP
jgi:hypothetical protein